MASCGPRTVEGPPPGPAVSVAAPIVQEVVDWDDFVGRFEASQEVQVRARVAGYIQAVHFRDGQYVKQGQLLFTLDPRTFQAALAAAQADQKFAESDFQRAETLIKSNAISQEEYESKRSALAVAEATLTSRTLDLEFTRVTAPISGVVSDRRLDAGNLVEGGNSSGDVLTTIVSVDPIYFTFDASEALLLKYQRQARAGKAAPVRVRLQDESDYAWSGALNFSDNAIDASSGAIRMRAAIRNRQGFLKPGMFGHARVVGSGSYKAMMIPEVAVVTDGARKVAYVVGADGSVAMKLLQLGPLSGQMRVVRAGLAPDDRVIVDGVQRAHPGAKVTAKTVVLDPKTAEPDAEPARSYAPPASAATPARDAR